MRADRRRASPVQIGLFVVACAGAIPLIGHRVPDRVGAGEQAKCRTDLKFLASGGPTAGGGAPGA